MIEKCGYFGCSFCDSDNYWDIQEEIMGQAKREMEEHAECIETVRVLMEMVDLVEQYPSASIPELYEKAKFTLAMRDEAAREQEELQRKMEKDD